MLEILIATKNPGKVKEIKDILRDLPLTILTIPENDHSQVEEDGKNYFENALKKAKFYGDKYGYITLADDSGLEIDVLNGKPGIHSARFLGENTPFEQKMSEILKMMQNAKNRSARFRTVAVLYLPKSGKVYKAEGVVEGSILTSPQKREGSGFGYDPIFKPEGFNESFSMLGEEVKNKISHRSKALKKIKEIIKNELLGGNKMVEIKINGKRLPANKYVYEVFKSVIFALLGTLKNIPEIETVEITIKKDDKS